MGKTKSSGLARLPNEQKHQFLIGPVCSWFMPDTTDLWTRPNSSWMADTGNDRNVSQTDSESLSDNLSPFEDNASSSFFVYGSIGCFCYGEIHYNRTRLKPTGDDPTGDTKCDQNNRTKGNNLYAIVNKLVDIKDDNSRVSCIRFLQGVSRPMILALTESGTLIIYDLFKDRNLLQFKKTEILSRYAGIVNEVATNISEPGSKRAKLGSSHQINSCSWLNSQNIFLAISSIKEKSCSLLWLKVKDLSELDITESGLNRDTFVESHQTIPIKIMTDQQFLSPICLMKAIMLNGPICIISIGMDDGLIVVVVFDVSSGQVKRNIVLSRHNTQISSMSLDVGNLKKFPLGLLASVSRDGLMLLWDIENEFYFADYQASNGLLPNKGPGARINWFAVKFFTFAETSQQYIAVSNLESSLTVLEVPKNARSKTRLRDTRDNNSKPSKKQQASDQIITKHNALIFNIEYCKLTQTFITSSLDGSHILWTTDEPSKTSSPIIRSQYLIPAMLNNARVHMIRSSPIREDLVCLSLGKAGIKFHKISNNCMERQFDMTPSCSLVARKIAKANVSTTSIAWHPNHEYRLAIGTLEGKVFRADITLRKGTVTECLPAEISKRRTDDAAATMTVESQDSFGVEHAPLDRNGPLNATTEMARKQNEHKTDGIYSLSWGPNPASPDDVSKYAIYAVGSISHKLFIYYSTKDTSDKMTDYLDEFGDVSLPEANGRASEVAWKQSMDLMAMGTIDGKVLILKLLEESHEGRSHSRLFRKITIIEGPLGSSFVQCLAWHPSSDKDDQYYYYIAVSSHDSPAYVFNLKESILIANVKNQLNLDTKLDAPRDIKSINMPSDKDSNQLLGFGGVTVLAAFVNKLDAHSKAITDIAWSPHNPDQLATSSFDRLCFVWLADSSFLGAKLLSKFTARDRLFTIDWSLVDPDLIFTSGHDSTIWAWRPSENRC